jgi:hypothetical protein
MFDRISRGFQLVGSSWRVLRTDKKLIVFPILSGICCILVLLSFWTPVLIAQPGWLQFNDKPPAWFWGFLFLFYFVNYFVIVFFNAALVSCAIMRFHGETPTVGDGLRAAASRFPQILAWAFVSATVGILLKAIENAHEKAGEIVSAILGTVWTIITYFVVPVLVVEKLGPIQAIKRSVSIMKQTWGETLVSHFGIGLIVLLLMIPAFLLFVGGVFVAQSALPLGIMLLILGVLYFLLVLAISSALSGIHLAALYQFAAFGVVPEGYDREMMTGAFGKK